MTAAGAYNVGSIEIAFDGRIATNLAEHAPSIVKGVCVWGGARARV